MPRRVILLFAVVSTAPIGPAERAQAVGTVHFATSCAAAVQPRFDRAVALLHSFAFGQATAGFLAVLADDPGCAIAWWGVALSAWGNPFAAGAKPAAWLARGRDAVSRGRLAGAPTARESGYLEAVARLYERSDSLAQPARLAAYREAMAALAAREPADTEAAIFHALAVAISADPADKTYASQLEAGATLERLYAKLPNHPGLAHYIIHAYDVPPLAPRALAAARGYARIAPELSHALHMPSHAWTRLGRWEESIAANLGASTAARREGSTAEELHAADYLEYAYLQRGEVEAARRILDSLPGVAGRFDPASVTSAAPPAAGWFALAAIPARYAMERGAWREAAALELRPSPVPFADAITWFARGVGAARSGDTVRARGAVVALAALRDRLSLAHETYWSEQVDIQRAVTAGWLAWASGAGEAALDSLRAAALREDATEKNVITPGPLAPARELLGEMLLEMHQARAALDAFETTLSHEPGRRRALAGAAAARKAISGS